MAAVHNKTKHTEERTNRIHIISRGKGTTSLAMVWNNYTQYFRHSQWFEYAKISPVRRMISYKPFYETLFKRGITEYALIFKQGFSANTFHRMKKGEAISTKTLDALCYALDCEINDIIEFVKE